MPWILSTIESVAGSDFDPRTDFESVAESDAESDSAFDADYDSESVAESDDGSDSDPAFDH